MHLWRSYNRLQIPSLLYKAQFRGSFARRLDLLSRLVAAIIATMIRTPYLNWYGTGFKLRAAITIACQLAFVLFGYDQGVFSGIVGNADFLDTFDHPSPALEGIIVSIYNLGCFTGCILTFIFAEKTGRKLAMWIAMVWIIVSVAVREQIHDTDRDRLAQSSKQQPIQSLIS